MIFEFIINLFLKLFKGFISLLPNLSFSIPSGIINTLVSFFVGVNYFFPIKALMPIITFSIGLTAFRLLYNIILRIKSFIPTMGD